MLHKDVGGRAVLDCTPILFIKFYFINLRDLQLLWILLQKISMYLSLSLAIKSVLRCCIMDILETVVKAKRVVSLQVSSASASDELSWVLIYCKTISTSNTKTYLGCGCLWLNIPANKAQTFGCLSTDLPSIWTWYAEIADLKEFTATVELR